MILAVVDPSMVDELLRSCAGRARRCSSLGGVSGSSGDRELLLMFVFFWDDNEMTEEIKLRARDLLSSS